MPFVEQHTIGHQSADNSVLRLFKKQCIIHVEQTVYLLTCILRGDVATNGDTVASHSLVRTYKQLGGWGVGRGIESVGYMRRT